MKRFLKHYRLSENIEVLFMLTLGIVLQTTDGSPFTIRKRWATVWDTELPPEHFSQFTQKCIKTILSCIVIGRCLTTYLYVMSAMLVMFSIIKDSLPGLMLFWLLIAATKSLFLTFIEALTGVYVCSAFGKIRKACVEFFISKALEIIFAAYLWGSVLSIYEEMVRKETVNAEQEKWIKTRPRARSLLDESTLYKTARLNSFEFKDVPQIILQMLRREEEMSQDSLLGPGMMLASVSNFGSFADIKTSQSLGELGLLDLKEIRVVGLEEDDMLLPHERALKFLKMNWNDVRRIQETRKSLDSEIFVIDEETWHRVETDRGSPRRPKQARPEIILQGIPRLDLEQEVEFSPKNKRKNNIDLEFGFSLFSFIGEKDELPARDEEQHSSTETLDDDVDGVDEEDDESSSPLFMSNIREEVTVNRIRLDFVSKKIKGNAYEKLYKEEYMSVIGPEVFDRATKLPKVTSLLISKTNARTSVSLPVLAEVDKKSRKKINFDITVEEKWKPLNDSFFSLDHEMLDEKQNEIDYTNDFVSSSHSLDEDFNPQEAVLFQKNEKKPLIIETNDTGCSDVEEKKEEKLERNVAEKREESLADEIQTGCEKMLTTGSNIEKGSDVRSLKKEVSSSREKEEIAEAFEKPCDNHKFYYRTKRIKIKRIGKQPQNDQSNPTISNQNERKDDCNDGSSDSENQTNFSMRCEEKTPSRDGNRIVRVRNLRNFFRNGNGTGGCNDEERGSVKRNSRTTLPTTKPGRKQINDLIVSCFGSKHKIFTTKQTECRNRFGALKSSEFKRDTETKMKNEKPEKIWKSKVLRKVAIVNPVISGKRESSHDFYGCYASVMNASLTKNAFKTRKRTTNEAETKAKPNAFGSNRTVLNEKNEKDTSLDVFYEQILKNPSNDVFLRKTGVRENRSKLLNFADACVSVGNREKEPHDCQPADESMEATSTVAENDEDVIDSTAKSGFGKPADCVPENSNENLLLWDKKSSEEFFSLYYSKAADLASPLLDMKRFIYPDHIHYSYKHVKKKGFDVNINNGLPLIVRESLTMNESTGVRHASMVQNPELKIIRRPMDLSFASTNSWKNLYLSDPEIEPDTQRMRSVKEMKWSEPFKDKKKKKIKKGKKEAFRNVDRDVGNEGEETSVHQRKQKEYSRGENDELLMEKLLLKAYKRLNGDDWNGRSNSEDPNENDHPPLQISSTQLHSNKGKIITANYIPALVLNENKTKSEKRKMETLEERTKDMFARLEREVLFQNKNYQKNFEPPNDY